jgi:hypothetical protein
MIFFSRHYEGVIDEAGFPYKGLDCTASIQAMAWCGRYQAYEQAMINDESGFVNQSQIFLGLGTARRLSELSGVDEFTTPTFEIDGVTDALVEVSTLGIVAAAPLADAAASILDDVLVTAAAAIFDAVFVVLKSLLETCKLCSPAPPLFARSSHRSALSRARSQAARQVRPPHLCRRGRCRLPGNCTTARYRTPSSPTHIHTKPIPNVVCSTISTINCPCSSRGST